MRTKAMEYSLETRRKNQAEHAGRVFPYIEFYRKQGYGWKMIARLLDMGGIPAPRGGRWHANQVRRIYNQVADHPFNTSGEDAYA